MVDRLAVGGKVEAQELYEEVPFTLEVWVVESEGFHYQAVRSTGVECLDVCRVDLFWRTVTVEQADRLEHVLCEVGAVCDVLA